MTALLNIIQSKDKLGQLRSPSFHELRILPLTCVRKLFLLYIIVACLEA